MPIRDKRSSALCTSGFTLVEVMVGAALGSIILAGILSTFLFLLRSGANLGNYDEMQTEARYATEVFAEDVRQASAITWNSSTSMTINVNSTLITYAYTWVDDNTRGYHGYTFTRTVSSGTPSYLIKYIVSGSFSFSAYSISDPTTALSFSDLTTASKNTKQVQISLRASRTSTTVVSATNLILSARYILRNKIVTA